MTFWIFVYAAAAVQAALLATVLWWRQVNPWANKVLAIWVALVGLDLLVKAVFWHSPSAHWLKAYVFVGLFPFLYGSAFFLYVRTLTQARKPSWPDLVHVLGFVAALATQMPVLLMSERQTSELLAHWAMHGRASSGWFDIGLFVYSFGYVVAALVLVQRYRRRLRERRSDADRLSLRWIDIMAGFQILIWCIALAQWLARVPGINYGLLFGAVAAWVCTVGWLSMNQPPVVTESEPSVAEQTESAADDDPRFPQVEARLSQLMAGAEAMFLEPALTIAQLARRSGYPEYLVSAVINRRFGCSFWDYINRLRIDATCASLADAGDPRTILDIAYACGFTSKSTFNAAFKKQVGQTPSVWRRRGSIGKATTP